MGFEIAVRFAGEGDGGIPVQALGRPGAEQAHLFGRET